MFFNDVTRMINIMVGTCMHISNTTIDIPNNRVHYLNLCMLYSITGENNLSLLYSAAASRNLTNEGHICISVFILTTILEISVQ